MFLIVSGNPVDGFAFFGPFHTPGSATMWAARNIHDEHWWLARTIKPRGI